MIPSPTAENRASESTEHRTADSHRRTFRGTELPGSPVSGQLRPTLESRAHDSARRVFDRLFSPHDRVYIYNLMPEDGLEDLLNLVANLSKKIETIGDAVALDASVLGEQIETKELDKVMNVGNQQEWHTLVPERSEVGWRSGELPEDPVVLSSPFDCLSLYLLPSL